MIFLDNFTSTKPSTRALEMYHKIQREHWMPHFAPYHRNKALTSEIDHAIDTLYQFVGADEDDFFVPTSGEEENISFVIQNVLLQRIAETGKTFILTPCTEGAPILKTLRNLDGMGVETIHLPVDKEGRITREILEKEWTPKASMLALSWIHPLTGVIQPLEEIGAFCKEKGVLLFVQGSEAFGKLFFKFQDLPIDFLGFSGDKFHAPKGVGGLFIKADVPVKGVSKKGKIPLVAIKDVAGLISLRIAIEEASTERDLLAIEMARLRAQFEESLKSRIPEAVFFGRGALRVPTTTAFAIPGIHRDLLLLHLYEKRVVATYGGGMSQKLDYILETMEVPRALAKCGLSITLSKETTEEEMERASLAIIETAESLLFFSEDLMRGHHHE